MLQWAFYVLVVSLLISVAGAVAELALRRRHLATRSVWLVALLLCVGLSLQALRVSRAEATPGPRPETTARVRTVLPIRLPEIEKAVTAAPFAPRMAQTEAVLQTLWILASALVAVSVGVSTAHVYLRRRRWPMQMVAMHCVSISRDVGPAVIGLLRPTIVLPEWVLGRSPVEQRLIVAHEAAHLHARDPLALTVAVFAVLLMPWNPLLWWQMRRLRHAIEVDCDARVLAAGHDLATYGATLIEVGQRRSHYLGTVAAMSENRTLLEERIEVMSRRTDKSRKFGFLALSALSLSVALAATQVTSPDPSGTPELDLDATTLDRYVGHYQISPARILTVTRAGGQLSARISGQPVFPIYADGAQDFHWKAVAARVSFSGDADGLAATATIHQNGADIVAARIDDAAAAQAEEQLSARIAAQQPQAGAEAALRRTMSALASGSPNYEDMDRPLQNAVRAQAPAMNPLLAKLGPVQTVEFKGVSDGGADKYLVTHQNGKQSQWVIALSPDGRIATLAVLPVF